jgi:hypothetical protein
MDYALNLKKHLNRKGAKNAKEMGFARMGGFIAQLAKSMCLNSPSHWTGKYQTDFIALFSLRLRVFAVNELWF